MGVRRILRLLIGRKDLHNIKRPRRCQNCWEFPNTLRIRAFAKPNHGKRQSYGGWNFTNTNRALSGFNRHLAHN